LWDGIGLQIKMRIEQLKEINAKKKIHT
jgi:hypothetical protein